jgi:hypothetical protein
VADVLRELAIKTLGQDLAGTRIPNLSPSNGFWAPTWGIHLWPNVESNYDPSVIGGVGEIGLMQIRPGTAAMLGFRGSTEELAKPEINIHYGVAYLSKAWRLANGDLCRTLMKYRAGHGQEVMTPRSVNYCNRARNHLAAWAHPLRPEDRRRLLSSRLRRLRTTSRSRC